MKTSKYLLTFLLGVCIVFFSNCEKEKEDSQALPPLSTLDMDFSFSTMRKSAVIDSSYTNYVLAQGIVVFWSLKAAEHSILTIAAYKKALTASPTKTKEGNWSWSTPFSIGSTDYLSEITAIINIEEDSISYSMSIAEVGASSKYTYCFGKSDIDRTGGWWKLIYPYGNIPVLRIDWTYENENACTLKYTNIVLTDPNYGGFIEFGKVEETPYNRYFKIYIVNYPENLSLNGRTISINWNKTDKNGQIKLDDSVWGCWDNLCKNKATCE